jgi:nucleotide-binding universal stress UspA family protein
MFKSILLAVDGSEPALRAAKTAGELARQLGSDVRVVYCYEPIPTYLGEPNLQEALNARLVHASKIINPALSAVGHIPGALIEEKLEGPPAETILNVIEIRDVDLVVMGTRGLSQLAGLLLGSQSQKVAMHAKCPVMLVH